MIRKHIIFYGRVQGVGFRYYSVHKARQLGLTGWVKNCYDGTVEMEVQGWEEQIDELILFLERQAYIHIDNIDVKSQELKDERDFYER
ncbi:MAG: acylphosphatase [Clostridiales bacterium]|nr:acylphosphatase [Clostridiales bacterium]